MPATTLSLPVPSAGTTRAARAAAPSLRARRPQRASQDLSRAAWCAVFVAVVLVHLSLLWALWQVRAVREAVSLAAPLWVHWVAAPEPVKPPPLPPPPPPTPVPPRPTPPKPAPRLLAAPAVVAAPVEFSVPPPDPAPRPVEPVAPIVVAAPAPPAPAAPPAPVAPPAPPPVIPASAVQYLQPPALVYPRLSRRLGESGQVKLRVWIDAAGLPGVVQVHQSSGHARLDEAALAAVRQARFKPYTVNGQPTAGWAFIPLSFDLEP